MTIGQKIKSYRIKRGVSQQTLANQIGVGRMHITKIELGVEPPSLYLLVRIAQVLQIKEFNKALKILGAI